jgi:hypothetical protein
MFKFLTRLLLVVRSRMRSQARLKAEDLVLGQQVLILIRKSPMGERLRNPRFGSSRLITPRLSDGSGGA